MLKTLVIPERARNVAIAVAVAAFAAIFTGLYVSNYKERVRSEQETVGVLVAAKPIEAGTPGREVIKKGLAKVEELPRRNVVVGAFSSPDQIGRLVVSQEIHPGEQVTAHRLVARQASGVRAKLEGNMRAVEVVGTRAQLLAGTLKEGDRTDVVANFEVKSTATGVSHPFTRTILRDILVLRAAQSTEGGAVTGDTDEVSTQLALTDAQAQKLYFAMENATRVTGKGWWLTIRPVNDSVDSPESIETILTTLRDGLRDAQIRKAFFGGSVVNR